MSQPKQFDTLRLRMQHLGMKSSSPGWQIVMKAKLLPPIPGSDRPIGDNDTTALKKLMKSFFDYGRKNWSWIAQSSPSGADGGLVLGKTKSCACATFNLNFKWLAEKALDIDGIALKDYKKHFLTVPGSLCIDHAWQGNVETHGGVPTECYKFSSHYWVTHSGLGYDVCFNETFSGTSFIWTKLLDPDADVLRSSGQKQGRLFKLQKSHAGADYLMMTDPSGQNGWPVYQLLAENQLPTGT